MNTGDRIKLIYSAVQAKMVELTLSGNFSTYSEVSKACVYHFNKMYQENPESTHRVLVTQFNVAEIFIKYVSDLDGFDDLLRSPDSINRLKNLGTKKEKPMAQTEPKKQDVSKIVLKAFKHFNKTLNFEEATNEALKHLEKNNPELEVNTVEGFMTHLAISYFKTFQTIKNDPVKFIGALIKNLTTEQVKEVLTTCQAKIVG